MRALRSGAVGRAERVEPRWRDIQWIDFTSGPDSDEMLAPEPAVASSSMAEPGPWAAQEPGETLRHRGAPATRAPDRMGNAIPRLASGFVEPDAPISCSHGAERHSDDGAEAGAATGISSPRSRRLPRRQRCSATRGTTGSSSFPFASARREGDCAAYPMWLRPRLRTDLPAREWRRADRCRSIRPRWADLPEQPEWPNAAITAVSRYVVAQKIGRASLG